MRVLIADDQKHARSGLRALLCATAPDVEIEEAADGLEAERAAEEFRPDIVVLDLHMPREDGLAALRWLRAHLPQVRLLAMSIEPAHEAEALAAGADAFACKCESPERLLAQLARLGLGTGPRDPS